MDQLGAEEAKDVGRGEECLLACRERSRVLLIAFSWGFDHLTLPFLFRSSSVRLPIN